MNQPSNVQSGGNTSGPGSSGTDAAGNMFVTGNLTVGAQQMPGDNGQGVLRLANAAAVPSTNPVGGLTMFTQQGGVYVRDGNGTVSSMVNTLRTGATSWGAIAETVNHNTANNTVIQPASGELQLMQVGIEAGQTISNMGFVTGSTASVGPTHWWVGIWDQNYVQQAHSLDQTSTALPATTWQKLALTAPYMTPYSGNYYFGLVIASSVTQPSVVGSTVAGVFVSGTNAPTPGIGGRSSTGLTIPGVNLSTVATIPTAIGGYYYMYGI